MPTFLVTAKMSPALAARVERSVTGTATSSTLRRLIVLARFGALLAVGFALYALVVSRRAAQQAEDGARAELLASADELAAALTPEQKELPARVEPWLGALAANAWPGDELSAELRGDSALSSTLRRPTLYVRGPLDGFDTSAKIAETAKAPKDALVLCLLDPPVARTEKALVERVRVAYSGGQDMEQHTQSVRPLHDAMAALPFFLPAWTAEIRAATDEHQLDKLRAQRDAAPIERTRQAAQAEILLIAIDEPGADSGHTELDGERPHHVRLAIVDLQASKLLLRLRRPVDPSWLSETRRVSYARGLDSCALALDVRAELAVR